MYDFTASAARRIQLHLSHTSCCEEMGFGNCTKVPVVVIKLLNDLRVFALMQLWMFKFKQILCFAT